VLQAGMICYAEILCDEAGSILHYATKSEEKIKKRV
jgi:hypothetical protein